MTQFATKRQYLTRLEPFLLQFGYRKPTWSQALQDGSFYDYYLTRGNLSSKLTLEDWSLNDRFVQFLKIWIDVPHPERFLIYTANLQNVADSLLFESYWSSQKLDDWLNLGIKVVCETPYVDSLRQRLESPVMQATLNSLLAAQDSFYLFGDVTYGFYYSVALFEPLEQRASRWLSAAEQFAAVFDAPDSLAVAQFGAPAAQAIAQKERSRDNTAKSVTLGFFLLFFALLCLTLILGVVLLGMSP